MRRARARRMRRALLRTGEEIAQRVGWTGHGHRYLDEVVRDLVRDWSGGDTRHVDWILARAWARLPRRAATGGVLAGAACAAAIAGSLPAAAALLCLALLGVRRSATFELVSALGSDDGLRADFLREHGLTLPARILTHPVAQQVLLDIEDKVRETALSLAEEYGGTAGELIASARLLAAPSPGGPAAPNCQRS